MTKPSDRDRNYAPRGLRREAAAWYVGLSTSKFDELVTDGLMPKPMRVGRCVIWDRHQLDAAFDNLMNEPVNSKWDDNFSGSEASAVKATQELIRSRLLRRSEDAAYDVEAWESRERGEIEFHDLPPGKYPGGIRIYADGEWKALVRGSPMQKREISALEAYFNAKGTLGYVKGGGWTTTERLAARGYVEIIQKRDANRFPFYGITSAGEAEWLKLSRKL